MKIINLGVIGLVILFGPSSAADAKDGFEYISWSTFQSAAKRCGVFGAKKLNDSIVLSGISAVGNHKSERAMFKEEDCLRRVLRLSKRFPILID